MMGEGATTEKLSDAALEGEDEDEDVGEWWERLYKPHFTAADWDAMEVKAALREEEEENVYRRIWKEMREKEEKIQRGEIVFEGKLRNVGTQTASCIWNAKELELLKGASLQLKTENRRLQAVAHEQQERLAMFERKCRSQNRMLEKKDEKLSEALKANERLAILVSTLKKQLIRAQGLSSHLEGALALEKETVTKEREELAVSRERALTLESEVRQLETRLQEVLREEERALQVAAGAARAAGLEENAALLRRVTSLESELRRERVRHSASRRGLDHLVSHFARQKLPEEVEQEVLMAQMQYL